MSEWGFMNGNKSAPLEKKCWWGSVCLSGKLCLISTGGCFPIGSIWSRLRIIRWLYYSSPAVRMLICAARVSQGATVENICSELRYLPVTRTLAEERALLILCDLSYSTSDAVEVALVNITRTHFCLQTLKKHLKGFQGRKNCKVKNLQ